MWISKNRSIFFFSYLLTTYKPKIVMIHEEMHPVLRKTLILRKMHSFGYWFCRFLPKKCEFQKHCFIFLFPHLQTTHKPKIVMIHGEMHHVLRKNDFAKNAQFWLLILPFFTLKMRILKIVPSSSSPPTTTHKPKIVMIHEEMHPVLRKPWLC